MTATGEQKGFTLIEVVVASLLLTFLVAVLLQYHGSSGVSKNQGYYLKAVQVARAELEKLRALYEMVPEAAEFAHTGPPPCNMNHHRTTGAGEEIELPPLMYHVYYHHHNRYEDLLRPLGDKDPAVAPPYSECPSIYSGVSRYHEGYELQFAKFSDTDNRDRRTFTYFTYDACQAYPPDSDKDRGKVDASVVVIDDMGSPYDPKDDLLGNIGWWIEDVAISGVTYCKKVYFALAFWYPGQSHGHHPEVICLKTTMVKP